MVHTEPSGAGTLRSQLKGIESFTPGPWRWEVNITTKTVTLCGGPPKLGFGKYDLSVLEFKRWGTHSAAPVFWKWDFPRCVGTPLRADEVAEAAPGREHHERWFRIINHPDAHLIAAAPDLYRALQDCLREHGGFTIAGECQRNAQAALAKARGDVAVAAT